MGNTRWRTRRRYTEKVDARKKRRDELFKRIARSSFPITPILSAKHLLNEEDLANWGIREDGLVVTLDCPYHHRPEEAMTMVDYLTKRLGLGGDCNAE